MKLLFYLVIISVFTIYVPPFHWSVVLIFNLLLSSMIASLIGCCLSRKMTVLIFFFSFVFFTLLALELLDFINLLLLTSLCIGVIILIQ